MGLKYKIFSGDLDIGESDLEHFDDGMNVYDGIFMPSPGYSNVKNVFLIFGKATITQNDVKEKDVTEYYRQRDLLDLKVFKKDGTFFGSGVIHIVDYSFDPEIGEQYEIVISGI